MNLGTEPQMNNCACCLVGQDGILRPVGNRPGRHKPHVGAAGLPSRRRIPSCPTKRERGFTLLEVLVASAIMGIAIAGILSALSTSSRNAARLTQIDRATMLAQQKMDEILVDQSLPRKRPLQGNLDANTGWRAQILPFEAAPGAGAGQWVVDRVELELWWMDGPTRRSITLEGFRRGLLKPGDM